MNNDSIDKNQTPANAIETNNAGSPSSCEKTQVLTDSELDGVAGGAIYMKVDGIVKEDNPKVPTTRVQP